MCRILASISREPISIKGFLVEHECSLIKQSVARKDKLQKDGWGIAWYENGWNIIKSQNPVFEERERIEAIGNRKYSLFIAHIRKASNPMNLPLERLRAPENTQPFRYKKWIFAHNGQINHPNLVKRSMGEWSENIEGINDSEVYFWLLMKYIEEAGDVKEAIKATINHLNMVLSSVTDKIKGKGPYSALNMVLSDGERIYAYCRYDGKGKDSLCLRNRPYYQMHYLKNDGYTIIASEMTYEDGWKPIEDGSLLIAERDGNIKIVDLK